ncbi:MAG TPA: hypothetical protein VN752_07895 [Solirubrobacterales bacterium]|nr:hypothetical protein [Solirubrobacterales bacterium]
MRRLAIASLLAVLLTGVVTAQGEEYRKGNLRVSFDGDLRPRALPRERPAPVTVRLDGSVGTFDGSRPPQLRSLSVAMNRAGRIFVAGLPTCRAAELQQTSSDAALATCRAALVGRGRFGVEVDFSDTSLIPAQGKVLVFNTRLRGKPGLLLHLYGSSPVRAAFVLPFRISRRENGEFGTVFSTRIPQFASDLGYVTDIELTIGRTYRYGGKQRSFLSASCAAPTGFPGAIYDLAKTTFVFAGGIHLVSRLTRDCTVR